MSEQSNTPTLSCFIASILLYFIVTALISLLIGTVLYALGLLPLVVLSLATGLNSILGLISLLLGVLVEKPFPKRIWKNANRALTIIAIIITVLFLTSYTLGISSAPKCVSLGTCSPATATTVARANATATTVARANATATAEANAVATFITENPDPYPPYGWTLNLYDLLNGNSNPYGWSIGVSSNGGACQFTEGALQVIQPKQAFSYCHANKTHFVNLAYQVDMKIVEGDCGGIIFRTNSEAGNFYSLEVCGNGGCRIALYLNNDIYKSTDPNCISAVRSGLGQTNTIAVVANNNILDMYVNQQKIDSRSDNLLSQGQIGVVAHNYSDTPTEVVFNTAKVWTP